MTEAQDLAPKGEPQEEKKTLYTIGMHESLEIDGDQINALRVPGGWIYEFNNDGVCSYVFVPKPVFKNKSNKPSKDTSADKELEAFLHGQITENTPEE